MKSREVHLKRRPEGLPEPDDFEIVETEVAAPEDGQVVVENLFMSVDPYMRGRMRDRESYAEPFGVGEVMTGGAVGRVIESKAPDLDEGDLVLSQLGWRERFRADADRVSSLGEPAVSPSAYLGILGMPGLTAYVGLFAAAELKEGETVFVSGAAGAVGSAAGQIARVKGCRVLGSAGSEEKVRHLTEKLGFDHAFNYKGGGLRKKLDEGAPDGLDVYFDNVGGDHLEAAIARMRKYGRIALCGAISVYNEEEPQPGPANLFRAIGQELNLRGFIVSNHLDMRDDFLRDMGEWLQSGAIRWDETVYEGIERAPEAFIGLFEGANLGKMVVRLAEGEA